mgnify:FL=1
MLKQILLNSKRFHIQQKDLPVLIHGDSGIGASLFSVSLVSDLHKQGLDVFFLSGYSWARNEFEEQTGAKGVFIDSNFSNATNIARKKVIFIPSEQPELLVGLLDRLNDAPERVIFFKNFELFEEPIFLRIKSLPNLVLMGNLDKCSYADQLVAKNWQTKIFFSASKQISDVKLPPLEKYQGYLESTAQNGIVSLKQ